MVTYKYKATFRHDKFGKWVTTKFFHTSQRAKAEAEVAKFNEEHRWGFGYATLETVADGYDPLAERASETVARVLRKAWNL